MKDSRRFSTNFHYGVKSWFVKVAILWGIKISKFQYLILGTGSPPPNSPPLLTDTPPPYVLLQYINFLPCLLVHLLSCLLVHILTCSLDNLFPDIFLLMIWTFSQLGRGQTVENCRSFKSVNYLVLVNLSPNLPAQSSSIPARAEG